MRHTSASQRPVWVGLVLGLSLAVGGAVRGQEEPNVPTQPLLALDAGGHTACVNKVLFTPDGKELITVSDDKTIRVWDLASGAPLRVIRPPIGTGVEGMIYCAAISPDGQYLAIGGFSWSGGPNLISLISLADERIVRQYFGHENVIQDLAFSPDGRRLLSGSNDATARIWDVQSGECLVTLTGHTKAIYGVCWSPDGKRCATACYDYTAAIWSANSGQRLAVLKGHTAEVESVDWSADGYWLCTAADDNTVRIWDPNGRLLQTYDHLGEHNIKCARFTRDRSRVVWVHGYGTGDDLAGVIDLQTGQIAATYTGHGNTIMDGRISPDGSLVASCDADCLTAVWRIDDGAEVQRMVGNNSNIYAVAWSPDGKSIAFGDEWLGGSVLQATTVLTRSFDLSQLEFGDPVTEETSGQWLRARLELGSLRIESTGKTTADVLRGNSVVCTLQPVSDYDRLYDRIRCYTLLPGNRAVVGSNFGLWLYDAQTGERIRQLVGHGALVYAVSPSKDNRLLLSASGDSTIRLWSLDAPGDGPIEPLLSLFFAGNEWIAWTPQGYYAASAGGERLIGWHVNNGFDHMAHYHSAAQFRKQFYRPDVIKLLPQTGSVEAALAAVGAGERPKNLVENLPPDVEIVSPVEASVKVNTEEITVRVRATQVGTHPITSLQLMLNGRPLGGKGGIRFYEPPRQTVEETFQAPLISGVAQTIQARADNEVSYGLSRGVEVTYTAPQPEERLPALYVLAIGVAEYDAADLRLNFAGEDARRLAETLAKHGHGLFSKVETKVITDKEATQKGILGGLVWLKQQMTQHDIGVLFFSGHGDKDETGTFYLLPCDVDTEQPLILSAVSDAQVKGFLQGIPGRLLVLLDACHAGTLGGDRRKNARSLTDDLVRDLSNDDYGVVVMASSMGREFSLENAAKRSGMFTFAIVEGLTGQADTNGDGFIYFNELDTFVSERVKELTSGRQHPVTSKSATIRPFPLSRKIE